MSFIYGEKFKLEFADLRGNNRKVSILKKGYTGSVSNLVGTGDPVVIKWDADDDFYNPIIGSTCELNLFETDDTTYDNWYDADEREYKVQISTGSTFGAKVWDLQEDTYSEANFIWNEGEEAYEFYWEGFLIVDRYQEAVQAKPYPIKLIASDQLGLLKGFDAPLSERLGGAIVTNDFSGNTDPEDNNSNFDTAFYYIVEILKLTGLNFDIRVANNLRDSSFSANNTLFHEIQPYEFGVLGNNFKPLSAKKLLEKILEYTNSRIFQSNGSWYIISNSNIVDKRLLDPVDLKPSAEDIEIATRKNTDSQSTNFVGSDPQNLSLTFSVPSQTILGSVTATSTSFVYSPPNGLSQGTAEFTYIANNGTNDSDPATVKVHVYSDTTPVAASKSMANTYTGVSLNDAIASAVNNSATKRFPLLRSNGQRKLLQSTGDIEWLQVQDSVGTSSLARDPNLNGFFALGRVVPLQNMLYGGNNAVYAIAMNIRNGIIVERAEYGENFVGLVKYEGANTSYEP